MRIYHGSVRFKGIPTYGVGKKNNDYGLGFYCTENLELAKEWGCDERGLGYANEYELDTSNLNILYLNKEPYNILHWITLLLVNRKFDVSSDIAFFGRKYLIENYSINISDYDVVIGYRADDSYFSFARDFLNNGISINKLKEAMNLGLLGEQVVLISKKAFDSLEFIQTHDINEFKYYESRNKRDRKARENYLNNRSSILSKDDLFLVDIIRQEVKSDDIRLR